MVDVNAAATLKKIQRLVRWHYQCIVLHDFLPTIVGEELVFILPHLKSGKSILVDKPQLRFYRFQKKPFIPVEFSVAMSRSCAIGNLFARNSLSPEARHLRSIT